MFVLTWMSGWARARQNSLSKLVVRPDADSRRTLSYRNARRYPADEIIKTQTNRPCVNCPSSHILFIHTVVYSILPQT